MKIIELCKKYTSLIELTSWTLKQGVSSLLYDEIVASGVNPLDRKGLMRLAGYAQKQIGQWELQKESIDALARFCERNGIGLMLFKGYALSLLFDVPTSRRSGDVDVWFFEKKTTGNGQQATDEESNEDQWSERLRMCDVVAAGNKVDELLSARGVKVKSTVEKHTVFDIKGAHYENHCFFLDSKGHEQFVEVEDYLRKMDIVRSEEWNNVYYPSADFNAIYLPLHAAQHFVYSGACLKQLVDWPMFLKRCGKEVDWISVYALAEKVGSRKWFDVLNAIAVDMFDTLVECIGGEDYLHRDETLEWKVIDAFANSEEVDSKAPFLKLFYQKTMKQIRNRWKIELIFGENFLMCYLRHVRGYIRREFKR